MGEKGGKRVLRKKNEGKSRTGTKGNWGIEMNGGGAQ